MATRCFWPPESCRGQEPAARTEAADRVDDHRPARAGALTGFTRGRERELWPVRRRRGNRVAGRARQAAERSASTGAIRAARRAG
jgi:hypothetical protein